MSVDKGQIVIELADLPERIKMAEDKYRNAINELNKLKMKLLEKECEVHIEGKVKGKNDYTRNAELWPFTRNLHKEIQKAECVIDTYKVEYSYLKLKNDNLLMIAKLF